MMMKQWLVFKMFETMLEQKPTWKDDKDSIINKTIGFFEKDSIFNPTFDEYFELMGNNSWNVALSLPELDSVNESHRTAHRIAHFSATFATKGIDFHLFKEDRQEIITALISKYENSLVLPYHQRFSHTPNRVDLSRFVILSTRMENHSDYDKLSVGSCDRNLKFTIHRHTQTIENGMIRTEISLSDCQGVDWKDFDVWSPINYAEKRIIPIMNELADSRTEKTKVIYRYIECEGFKELNKVGQEECSKITNLSSRRCVFCTKLQQGDYDDYDNEPEVDETDYSAEDEAFHYMRLDNDIEIANGNMPQYNV